MDSSWTTWAGAHILNAECLSAHSFFPANSSLQTILLALHACNDLFIYLFGRDNFKGLSIICLIYYDENSHGAAPTSYLNKFFQRPFDYLSVCVCVLVKFASVFLCVCIVHTYACIGYSLCWSSPLCCDPFECRCTVQPSSSMSLTQRRTCLSVSAHSSACHALILDLMGPGVFTATRASVCSPTGPSSSLSGAFSLSSTDTPSPDHMPCLLKS